MLRWDMRSLDRPVAIRPSEDVEHMNLIYGEIVETYGERDMPQGKVRVRGALKEVTLALTPDAKAGDCVLVCDGVALSKVDVLSEDEVSHVSGDSR